MVTSWNDFIDLAPATSCEEATLIKAMRPTCAMESTVAQSKREYADPYR
jgi:hypothetical protein